jgi:hypothetical protein
MADYHAILRRAISAMPSPTGEVRRAVYEKARSALVAQLKAFEPPLSPSEITQQRLQLEDAIRRVESEAAKGLLRNPAPPAPPVRPPEPVAPEPESVTSRAEPAAAPPRPPIVSPQPTPSRPIVARPIAPPTQAMKRAVDEAEALGGATAELGRQARDVLDETAPADGGGVFAREAEAPVRKTETVARRKRREEARTGEKPKKRLPVLVGVTVAILVFAIGIMALWTQREAISAMLGGTAEPVVELSKRSTGEKLAPKVPDRLGSGEDPAKAGGAAKPVPTQTITTTPQLQSAVPEGTKTDGAKIDAGVPPQQAVALVAQKAILYEEGRVGSQAQILAGRVIWQLVPDPTDPKPGAVQLQAQIEIPERKMAVQLRMHPNADTSFPATHMVEIRFELAPDFDGKSVSAIPGLIMKATEQSRGDPLNGAVAKVTDNFFWVALSGEGDNNRNLKLLRERGWIDIPLLYETGRHAILTLEKAGAGDQVVNDALTAWGNGG